MCLLKAYLEKGENKELIAEDVAFVVRERNKVKLRNIDLRDIATLEDVDLSSIDTLNSVMILKSQK
ncbi:MAG: CooT family nickel-binding protein [Thermoproteota archaeon]